MNTKNILLIFLFIILLNGCDLFNHISENDYLGIHSGGGEDDEDDELPLYTTDINSPDLTIYNITVEKVVNDIRFNVDYQSGYERGYSFFNPPSGSIFMYYNYTTGIFVGRNIFTIDVPVSEVIQTNIITMLFLKTGCDDGLFINTEVFSELLY